MKKLLITLTATALLAACSHNPPKPYGKPFPINPQPSMTTEKTNP
ncbi:TPA: lipoprotein [Neisseria meningitidis]